MKYMHKDEMIKSLDDMKMHLDHVRTWIDNAMDVIYQIEEKIIDAEYAELNRKFTESPLYKNTNAR